jgi:RNA polymerase sigma-70 factor (ECF subfamily)
MVMSGLSNRDADHARLREAHPESTLGSDADLVAGLRVGEPGVAGRAYDRHAKHVHAVVYRLLGPDADLEDIVQEVFIYAFHSIDKLRDPAAFRSWLGAIATGHVRAHLRRRWRGRWLSFFSHEDLAELPGEAPDPHTDLLREVYGILDQLPPDERMAVVLRRIEDLSIQEAAQASGMSVSTFKRRYARGQAHFLARAKGRPALAQWLEQGTP